MVKLVQRDGHQEPPQVAAMFQIVAPVAGGAEKAAVDGLHHILGIDAARQAVAESAARQTHKLLGVTAKQLRCLLIAVVPALHQFQWVVLTHFRILDPHHFGRAANAIVQYEID